MMAGVVIALNPLEKQYFLNRLEKNPQLINPYIGTERVFRSNLFHALGGVFINLVLSLIYTCRLKWNQFKLNLQLNIKLMKKVLHTLHIRRRQVQHQPTMKLKQKKPTIY